MKAYKKWYALFTVPLMFIFFTVVIIPFVIGIAYSFVSWDGLAKDPMTFVGFSNYASVFSDSRFLQSAGHTVIFTLLSVLAINVLGLAFALMVTSSLKVKNVARTMLFMPYLIGGLILGYIWKYIFSDLMLQFGLESWLTDGTKAVLAMVIVMTWQMAGYVMIVYITGMMAIPDDVIEAAKIDGANYWQTLINVRLPLLMPSFTICLFLSLSNCFKVYDVNISLTGGGPGTSSEMFSLNIFNEIFSMGHYGYGQAKAIIFFLIIALITLCQVVITKKREVEM